MIYRCTARFVEGFDALPSSGQRQVLKSLKRFLDSPRLPAGARLLDEKKPHTTDDDIWHLDCGQGCAITYQILSDPQYQDDFVCVLRNIGFIEQFESQA